MKIKTSELKGDALDWAVAKCEGYFTTAGQDLNYWTSPDGAKHFMAMRNATGHGVHWTHASTDWSEGGPIIERERITSSYEGKGVWIAGGFNGVAYIMNYPGPTPLIAAMRCYVASKLGNEVEVPDELKGD